jgi:hypothetical protein
MTQSAPITRVSSAEVMDINTVPPMSREIVAEIPIDEDKVGVDPPPYSEQDRSHVPETGRGYAQYGNNKPVPLEKLEKEPGYVVVFPPLPPFEFALTKSVLFAILKVIQTRGTSHRVHSSFLLQHFVMRLVSLHLYHHYTYQNTAKRYIIADRVVTLSRNITRVKEPRW